MIKTEATYFLFILHLESVLQENWMSGWKDSLYKSLKVAKAKAEKQNDTFRES
jgi:hypothetical protein